MMANFTWLSSSLEIEDYLRAAFHQLNWIGELDLPPEQFELLCKAVRLLGKQGDAVNIERIPDLLLMTTMVFTARYAEFADDETPSFWRPYARMVWRLDDADQNFQQTCRRRFRSARALLEDEYDLFFPHKIDWHEQEVVSGIYMHAILPSYLEDDFARWLVGLWKQGETWARSADLPIEVVAAHMRHHPSLESIRRRLRHFIQGEETYETAARLVQTLAAAADEFARGTNPDTIAGMLSLVERAVWTELHAELTSEHEQLRRDSSGTRVQPAARVDLAWNAETGELALRARHLRGAGTVVPDRLVWVKSIEELPDYSHYITVNPWSSSDGWVIETAYLDNVGVGGVIALVDEQDRLLGEPLTVPEPPSANVLFFRLLSDGSYGVLTDPYRLSNGDYLVSSYNNVKLKDARTGEVLLPEAKFEPPDALYQRSHRKAARYSLRLPVDVDVSGDTLRLKPRRTSLAAVLQGNLVPGLAADTLPVFTDRPRLRLLNAASLVDESHYLRLRIIPARGQTLEMVLTDAMMQVERDDLVIDLVTCLPTDGGLYSLTLLHNVTRALPEPIQFAVLPPTVTIEVPSGNGYFTTETPPSVTIRGTHPDAVYTDTGFKQVVDDAVVVEWRQVWQPLRLQLAWQESRIPLQWSVLWRHAWIDPFNETLTLEDLGTTTIHLHGAPHETFLVSVGDESRRPVALNARGAMSFVIAGDRIKDMLRETHGTRVPVTASDGRTTWSLFTFIRPEIEHPGELYTLVRKALDTARWLSGKAPKTQARARITHAVLLALPEKEVAAFRTNQSVSAASILAAMQSVRATPIDKLAPWALPPTYPLTACLDGVSECLKVEAEQLPSSPVGYGQATVMLGDLAGERTHALNVTWKRDELTGLTAIAVRLPQSVLKVCSVCGCLFLENTSTKILHSHGKGWSVKHQDPSAGLPGTLTLDTEVLLVRWKPNLASAMDRETVRSFRLHKERAGRCPVAPFFTVDGYRHAVAEWALNLNSSELRTKLEHIIGSEFARDAASLRLRFVKERKHMRSLPLIYLSYLLEDISVDPNDSWSRLDLTVLIMAITCRAMAYKAYDDLPWSGTIEDETLLTLLDKATDACPSLMAWAFSWAELYFYIFNEASVEKEQ